MSDTATKEPEAPRQDLDETARVLYDMLGENTGRALCDSGGTPQYDGNGNYIGSSQGYGRAWERNQGRDFVREQEVVYKFGKHYKGEGLEVEFTINVFPFLHGRLDYNDDMDSVYREFASFSDETHMHDMNSFVEGRNCLMFLLWKAGILVPKPDDEEEGYWKTPELLMQEKDDSGRRYSSDDYLTELLKLLEEQYGELPPSHLIEEILEDETPLNEFEVDLVNTLMSDDGFRCMDGDPCSVNTYNGEDSLSQTLQYTAFGTSCEGYILLQIHNGADVRGGYTAPRVFDGHLEDMCRNNDAYIYLDIPEGEEAPEDVGWYTDDGYHWYANNCGAELKDFFVVDMDDIDVYDDDEYPVQVRELVKAINDGERQLAEMSKRYPDRAEKYQEQHDASVEQYRKDLCLYLSGTAGVQEPIMLLDDRAYMYGYEMHVGACLTV